MDSRPGVAGSNTTSDAPGCRPQLGRPGGPELGQRTWQSHRGYSFSCDKERATKIFDNDGPIRGLKEVPAAREIDATCARNTQGNVPGRSHFAFHIVF